MYNAIILAKSLTFCLLHINLSFFIAIPPQSQILKSLYFKISVYFMCFVFSFSNINLKAKKTYFSLNFDVISDLNCSCNFAFDNLGF